MGYGKRALQQLVNYYEGKIQSLSEDAAESEIADVSQINGDEVNQFLFFIYTGCLKKVERLIDHRTIGFFQS